MLLLEKNSIKGWPFSLCIFALGLSLSTIRMHVLLQSILAVCSERAFTLNSRRKKLGRVQTSKMHVPVSAFSTSAPFCLFAEGARATIADRDIYASCDA